MRKDPSLMPQCMIDALCNDRKHDAERDKFQYSATVLCKEPRQVQLEQRHKHEVDTPEPIDTWYTFAGDAFHKYLEENLKDYPRYICEKRLIYSDFGRDVGAKFDCYDQETKTLYDHKTTTTFIHGSEMKKEWILQLMINAYFLMREGYEVKTVAIHAIYVDWRESKLRYAKEDEYPASPSVTFSVPCWSFDECKALYESLLQKHIEQEETPDDDLPCCDGNYCWETPAKVAVYKEGGQRAIRLLDSYEDAHKYIKWKGISDARIEVRPAERKRCKDYCTVSKFCNQYQAFLAEIQQDPQAAEEN